MTNCVKRLFETATVNDIKSIRGGKGEEIITFHVLYGQYDYWGRKSREEVELAAERFVVP